MTDIILGFYNEQIKVIHSLNARLQEIDKILVYGKVSSDYRVSLLEEKIRIDKALFHLAGR
jgi:hypothetical protein